MKLLSIGLALFGIIALAVAATGDDATTAVLGATEARICSFRRFTATERGVAIAMVVFLVLINQAQVGITVRLSFFNRDLFNALSNKDAAAFWHQLLFVFTPWAFTYVASAVVE